MIIQTLFDSVVDTAPTSTDLLYNEIIAAYEKEESKLTVRNLLDKVTYASPVNFRESLQIARHRWFPYKEGFSPSFVRSFLNEFAPSTEQVIFDPFSGVATTLLEASRLGYSAYGFEVSPMSYSIAKTKAMVMDQSNLAVFEQWIKLFNTDSLTESSNPPDNSTVVSYFEESNLAALLAVKAFFLKITDPNVQALFRLAFLNCLERYSTHRKAGNGLKRKTRLVYGSALESPLEQIRQTIISDLNRFKADLIQEQELAPFSLKQGSCLAEELYPKGVLFDAVLTSPPYANCFDYSKIYLVELWMGDFFTNQQSQKSFRSDSLRSHVHARWPDRHSSFGHELVNNQIFQFLSEQSMWSSQIPTMIKGYFDDMGRLLSILSNHCRIGATVGLVVGNSYYGSLPVATDLLLTIIGRRYGFEPVRIDIYRNIVVSSQQFIQARHPKYMRESLVILRKI
jgi:hypothetical protein